MSTSTLRMLLFDDSSADAELIVRHLARTGLELEPLRVDSASGFDRALAEFRPDVILSDHGVPGFAGSEALARAKEISPTTPFIVVSGSVDPGAVVSSLRGGADDFVSKDDLARLRTAVDRALDIRHRLRLLSERQVEVFGLIARGLTTPEIAERLGISVKTVQTHRTALMRRLGVHDVATLVRYALKVRLLPPSED